MQLIDVLYTCHTCGVVKRKVAFRERGEEEDVRTWMTALRVAIAADHELVSLGCPGETCDLMVPMTGRSRIGGPITQ